MQSILQHGGGGSGLGVVSDGSMSEENSMVMSSVESSAYPDESELELGLGLSLGCGGGKPKTRPPPVEEAGGGSWDQYARILTAKDFTSVVSAKTSSSLSSSSSSSSSAIKGNVNGSCGTKRTAEPPSSPPDRSAVSQFVGWPPIRPYRVGTLTNHAKSQVTGDFFSATDKCNGKTTAVDKTNQGNKANNVGTKEKGHLKASLFVKVNMDGIPIGRKVDLSAHSCYETLTQSLDDMFLPAAAVGQARSHVEEQIMAGAIRPARLFNGSSDYVLTYEDKDGDWMLVGDVPWDLFLTSVRRLRIMRTTEANGLAPGSHARNRKQ